MNPSEAYRKRWNVPATPYRVEIRGGRFQSGPYRGKRISAKVVSRSYLQYLIVEKHVVGSQAVQFARECLRRHEADPNIFTYYDPHAFVGGAGPYWKPVAERIVAEAQAEKEARLAKRGGQAA